MSQAEGRVKAESRKPKAVWGLTSFQDGVTGTRFTLPPGPTIKPEKIYRTTILKT